MNRTPPGAPAIRATGLRKTTTVDMLLGLTRPDAGTVEVYDMSPCGSRSLT